uniref:Uncharacterized protein n=1 Tax=Myotis myotis TaxID=51298 RepID=A0A7J8AMN0_MYOMY|nr:hypothetical protein mMyoMyo1_007991 [Myotis myotis]
MSSEGRSCSMPRGGGCGQWLCYRTSCQAETLPDPQEPCYSRKQKQPVPNGHGKTSVPSCAQCPDGMTGEVGEGSSAELLGSWSGSGKAMKCPQSWLCPRPGWLLQALAEGLGLVLSGREYSMGERFTGSGWAVC